MRTSSSIRSASASAGGAVLALVQAHRLRDLLAHREHRVERGHRLLEDHRDLGAADRAHRRAVRLHEIEAGAVGAGELDPAPGDAAAAVLDQAHDRQRGHRFAGARLADDGDGLAGTDREADGAYRLDGALGARELHRQVIDDQDGGGFSFGAVTGLLGVAHFQGRPAGAAGRKTAIQPPSGSAGTAGRFISSAGTGRPWPKPARGPSPAPRGAPASSRAIGSG